MKPSLLSQIPARLAAFAQALPGVAERAPLLALVHDGFRLEGALVVPHGKKAYAVAATASSEAAGFAAALAEVVQGIGRPPRRALLVTACATPALLDLPVDATHPKSAREMLGLVRWELEPLMAEQIRLWTLGALLEGRGHLDRAARLAVAAELAGRKDEDGGRGARAPVRFGEVALERGLIRREQLEDALALQAQLQGLDDHVVCAWSPRATAHAGGGSLWLSVGLGLSVQARWVGACERLGIRLDAIFPLAGASLPRCPAEAVLVEIHSAFCVCARLGNGQPETLAYRPLGEDEPLTTVLAMLRELLRPDDRQIVLFATHPQGQTLVAPLTAAVGRPVAPLDPVADLPLASGPALAGVVAQFLGQAPALLPRLHGSEPLPPPLRRPQTWAAAAAGGLALLVAGYESAAALRMAWLHDEVSQATGERTQREQANARSEQEKQEAARWLAETATLRAEEVAAQADLAFFRDELGGRGEYLAAVHKALAEAVTSEVAVDAFGESGWFELSVSAWSLSQAAGYRFAKDLAQALAEWHFEVHDLQVNAQNGRHGQPGYAVHFKLARTPASPAPAEKTS